MPDHVRKQIRAAVTTLVTGLATTGANVFINRVHDIEAAKLPAIALYTNSETVEPVTMKPPRSLERMLDVVIEGVATANIALDDTLDTIIKEVETAISADHTLGGLAKDMFLTNIDISLTGDAQNPTGSAVMTWTATYYTSETVPTSAT